MKSTFTYDDSEVSVAEVIAELKDWHEEYWAKQPGDCSLVIKAVACHMRYWPGNVGALTSELLDIYIPPEGYTP
ncbi:MAG: hypothetical protein Q7T74_04825 [Candidatus Saccharibacteria bacterium]|nr:hypothetical protein [Candidatus Saccharibacteria bacterium]